MKLCSHTYNTKYNMTDLTREELAEVVSGLDTVLGAYCESLKDPSNEDDKEWLNKRIVALEDTIERLNRLGQF